MKPRKIRVALLLGGPSAEHDVSLASGKVVGAHLGLGQYEVTPVLISKSGDWPLPPEQLTKLFDVAFIAMHGEYGEDGTVQEVLANLELPYTGSDTMASSLAMNKILADRVFRAHGLKTPNSVVVDRPDAYMLDMATVSLPVVVKPADRGSSVGISLVREAHKIGPALERALALSHRALITEFISGRELTCSVIDDGLGDAFALPVTEIVPRAGGLFDYTAKYAKGASEEITPARLTSAETGMVQGAALRAHKAIGASGFSRTDMILGDDGHLYILEINTIPGMTETSLLPQAAIAHGMTLTELFERLIEAAFIRHASKGQ